MLDFIIIGEPMIRVLIVSPTRLVSDLLESVLAGAGDIRVIGSVNNYSDALCRLSRCDVLIVHAGMDQAEALRLTQSLSRTVNAPCVIIFGAGCRESDLLHFLEAGAQGCVSCEESIDELL